MDIKNKLLAYGKKSITLEALTDLLKADPADTKGLYDRISELAGASILEPVKNSGQNGNRKYPLFKKYRIMIKEESSEEVEKQIRQLHPALQRTGYLSLHVKEYLKHREVVDCLNTFLFSRKAGEQISRKERSFEIFGREKVLDDPEVKSLLRHLEISESDLGFYDTPEYCFHDYIPERKNDLTLLICENKDIWFNIRRCMFEDHFKSLFGVAIDGVVYGNGNKVSNKAGALVEYVRFMGNPNVTFLYWGDIDREGFDIFRRTRDVNDSLNIELFIPGYRKMIERVQSICLEDSPSSKKEGVSFENLFEGFSTEERHFLNRVLEENKLIPQEIIPYTVLKELLKHVIDDGEMYHLYIFDIEMPEMNGLQLAKEIRKIDAKALFVFLTGYTQYVMDVFEVITFDYISKPITVEKLESVLLKAMQYLHMIKRDFVFQFRKNQFRISCDDIVYFEKKGRQAVIHTISENFKANMTTEEIWKQLDDKVFAHIHVSYIINLGHIRAIDGDEVVMDNEERLLIARSHKQNLKEKHMEFVRRMV